MISCDFAGTHEVLHTVCVEQKKRKEKKWEKREWLRAMLFIQVLYGEKRERTWRVWSTIHVPHAGLVMQTWAMIEGLQSSQAPSTSVHDWEKSRMYCYLPFLLTSVLILLLFLPKFLHKLKFRFQYFLNAIKTRQSVKTRKMILRKRLYISKHVGLCS